MEVVLHLYARSSAGYFDLSGYPPTCIQAIYHRPDLSRSYTRIYRSTLPDEETFLSRNAPGMHECETRAQKRRIQPFRSIKLLRV